MMTNTNFIGNKLQFSIIILWLLYVSMHYLINACGLPLSGCIYTTEANVSKLFEKVAMEGIELGVFSITISFWGISFMHSVQDGFLIEMCDSFAFCMHVCMHCVQPTAIQVP